MRIGTWLGRTNNTRNNATCETRCDLAAAPAAYSFSTLRSPIVSNVYLNPGCHSPRSKADSSELIDSFIGNSIRVPRVGIFPFRDLFQSRHPRKGLKPKNDLQNRLCVSIVTSATRFIHSFIHCQWMAAILERSRNKMNLTPDLHPPSLHKIKLEPIQTHPSIPIMLRVSTQSTEHHLGCCMCV